MSYKVLAVAAVLICLLATPIASSAPILGPDQACNPGQSLVVAGAGAPAQAALLLSWGPRMVGGGVADAAGRYRLPLAIGQERGGTYEVSVLTRNERELLQRFRCVVPGAGTTLPPSPDIRPTPTATGGPPPFVPGQCEASYPDFCLPIGDEVNCSDITQKNFRVLQPDPFGLDGNSDGVGCEE